MNYSKDCGIGLKTTAISRGDKERCVFVKRQGWKNGLARGSKMGKVELFEILWDWAKKLQLNPEEIKSDVYLLKDKNETTAWHVAAKWGIVELFEELWDWAKNYS